MRRRALNLYAAGLAACTALLVAAGCAFGPSADSDSTSASDDVPDSVANAVIAPKPEAQVTIPPYPSDSDLVPLRVAPTSTASVYIDPNSLTVGDDVVRLTYVVVSRSGVHNVFYEGFRCRERVYKTYAWGVDEGPFHPMSDSEWKTIPWAGINRFRDDIRSYYLCTNFSLPRQREEILRYVRDITPYNY